METKARKLDTIRWVGRRIFQDESTNEVSIRKKMIYYADVVDYEEFFWEDFAKHGRQTCISCVGDRPVVILMDFEEFKKLHDKYLEQNEIENNKSMFKYGN